MGPFPNKSEKQCCETLNELHSEAKFACEVIAGDGDLELASILTAIYVSNQNINIILWHKLAKLEKKIDTLLSRESKNPDTKKRFEF